MISEAGHHDAGSQLYPNQDQCSVEIKVAGENILSRLSNQIIIQILSSVCSCKKLLVFLCTMALILAHALGQEQTAVCKQMDHSTIWGRSSVANPETIGFCPSSSAEQLQTKWMNTCIPHGHRNVDNHSPDPLGSPSPSRANVKEIVAKTVLVSFGGIGLVGLAGWMLCKRRPAFTEDDINMGLMRGPAVVRRSDSEFEIPLRID